MPSIVALTLILSPMIYISGHWITRLARVLTLAALSILLVVLFSFARDLAHADDSTIMFTYGMVSFYFNSLSLFITAIVLLLSTLVTIYSGPEMAGREGEEKYYAMLLLLTGAVIGMVCAGDLFNLWMWFETTAITSYLLVAFYRDQNAALAACAKYLIQTATGSIIVLFGIALIFAQTGLLDLTRIQLPVTPLMIAAGALLVIGFGVKLALVPTYTWLPDAYAEAPTGVSALLSGIVTISTLVPLLHGLALMGELAPGWGAVLIGFALLNIIVGNLLALRQDEVKRIFAYSSISHIGFVLLAIGIGVYTHHIAGFQSALLHIFNHAMMKALAFLAVGAVIYVRCRADSSLRVDDLRGLSKRDPVTALALVIACLSLAGIPPLAGFMSKWQIFAAGIASDHPVLILLMLFAALNSVLSLAYYLPIINAVFQPEPILPYRTVPAEAHLPIIMLTAGVIALGIVPGLLDGLILPAGKILLLFFGV